MFTIHDIDGQVWILNRAAEDLESKADALTHVFMASVLRAHADGLREAGKSLARMIEREVEREAREALR